MTTKKLPPVHPGEILLEEYLKPLGISQNKLGRDLNVPAQRINEIVRGQRAITVDTALRLGRHFHTTPQFWLNLQSRYDLEMAKETSLVERVVREVREREAAPAEIEDAIIRHPAVRDAVVGIPDEIMGQKVVAMVELEPGQTASQDLANDIIKSTMDVLATYKLPREVVFLSAIPRTPTGKIIKKELRKNYPEYPDKFTSKVK
jgi:addiction module HigA family antidote